MSINEMRKEWFEKVARLVKMAEEQAVKETIKEARRMEYQAKNMENIMELRLARRAAVAKGAK